MTMIHPQANVFLGSRWLFRGNLKNVDGSKMDLTSKTLEWALMNKSQQPVLTNPGDVIITKLDAVNGVIQIEVPKARALTLTPGRYTDYLRAGGEDILWTGQIVATASPFTS